MRFDRDGVYERKATDIPGGVFLDRSSLLFLTPSPPFFGFGIGDSDE
jgi:hypothetical protein